MTPVRSASVKRLLNCRKNTISCLKLLMNDPMYVGRKEFASYKEAADYCDLRNFSYTVIHHLPFNLPAKYQLVEDLEATSDKHWSSGPGDD